ncbi:hypothetical protein J2Z21_009159 [Streptomyces griseochromogenes]|uniref:Uncharacterized protein n=1 Tax=Streptomyces griseochromogenes TaxID=68214 RepID=A0ABS4M8Z1_9ACTN|nr:hypothetical protein [Streptomyces griseochromogenes]MBP2056142.1 hypothetical protein [Streptomyces griseochromogenes]
MGDGKTDLNAIAANGTNTPATEPRTGDFDERKKVRYCRSFFNRLVTT